MDERSLEEIPMDPDEMETEMMVPNPVLALITTEDGIPTSSTEVTVLTTAFGVGDEGPMMSAAALGSFAEVPLGTSAGGHHPTFVNVTSHGGVNTVYTTSIAPTHIGGPTVMVGEDGRIELMDENGVSQTYVVHTADAAQMSALTGVGVHEVEESGGVNIVRFQQISASSSTAEQQTQEQQSIFESMNITSETLHQGEEENDFGAEQVDMESLQQESTLQLESTEILTTVTEEGPSSECNNIVSGSSSGDGNEKAPSPMTVTEIAPVSTQTNNDKPQEPVSEAEMSMSVIVPEPELPPPTPPVPDEVICLVCYQAFLNPNKKKDEEIDRQTTNDNGIQEKVTESLDNMKKTENSENSNSYGRSLGNFFELSRVSLSIVTRRLYKDYEVPICQTCNEKLVQTENIIRDLKRLERDLLDLRQKIKTEIISSYYFFKNKENKKLAESRRNVLGLVQILDVVDRIREDIINDGRPPKIPIPSGSSKRGRKSKKLEEDKQTSGTGADPVKQNKEGSSEIATSSIEDNTFIMNTKENVPLITGDISKTEALESAVKHEEDNKESKPPIRTSFGRIVKRPAYMLNDLGVSDEELSDLDGDNVVNVELKPDLPPEPEREVLEAEASILNQEDVDEEEEEDPAWSPGRGLIVSDKVGLPTSSSEESEVISDFDSDDPLAPPKTKKVKSKKTSKEKKTRRQNVYNKKKSKRNMSKTTENVNYQVKVIQLDGTELMTINTTRAEENIGLEPEITQKVMDSQAVIMVKNQLFGKRVQCPHCPRSFTDIIRRDVHVKKKHEGDSKPFGCSKCPKRFGRQDHLRNHIKRHSRPPKVKSSKPTPAKTRKNHACQFCDQRFRNKSELLVHERTHTGERPFKCDHCAEGFVSALKREFHIEQAHPEVPPIRCDYCPRGFFRQHRLRIHTVSHTGEKTNVCELCGKCFSQAAMLRYHQTTHEELNLKQFKCQDCNRVFANPQNLKSHTESQHQKMYRHRCTTCGRGYTQMSHLRRHLRTHSGEQPFECSYCPKKFTSGAALKIHVRIHTGERPYWCSQCEKGFRSKTKLGRHMKTLIHAGDANKKKDGDLAEIQTMEVSDVNAASTTTWTEIVGIITGV